jgi:hypothetical protein
MASSLTPGFTEDLSPQFGDTRGFRFAPLGSMQCRQQTPCIPRRPKQVSRLNQPGEFSSRNEGNVSRASPPNDYRFLLIDDLIQNAGQVRAEARIRGFSCHQLYPFLIVQDSCTLAQIKTAHSGEVPLPLPRW